MSMKKTDVTSFDHFVLLKQPVDPSSLASATCLRPGEVCLVCCGGSQGFVVQAAAVAKHSTTLASAIGIAPELIAEMSPEDIDEAVIDATGSDDRVIELESESGVADARSVQLLATWLGRHESVEPSVVVEPMRRVAAVADHFSDPWDLWLFETASPMVPLHARDASDEDLVGALGGCMREPSDPLAIFRLAELADEFGFVALRGAALTFVLHYVDRLSALTAQPGAAMNRWLRWASPTDALLGSDVPAQRAATEQRLLATTSTHRAREPLVDDRDAAAVAGSQNTTAAAADGDPLLLGGLTDAEWDDITPTMHWLVEQGRNLRV